MTIVTGQENGKCFNLAGPGEPEQLVCPAVVGAARLDQRLANDIANLNQRAVDQNNGIFSRRQTVSNAFTEQNLFGQSQTDFGLSLTTESADSSRRGKDIYSQFEPSEDEDVKVVTQVGSRPLGQEQEQEDSSYWSDIEDDDVVQEVTESVNQFRDGEDGGTESVSFDFTEDAVDTDDFTTERLEAVLNVQDRAFVNNDEIVEVDAQEAGQATSNLARRVDKEYLEAREPAEIEKIQVEESIQVEGDKVTAAKVAEPEGEQSEAAAKGINYGGKSIDPVSMVNFLKTAWKSYTEGQKNKKQPVKTNTGETGSISSGEGIPINANTLIQLIEGTSLSGPVKQLLNKPDLTRGGKSLMQEFGPGGFPGFLTSTAQSEIDDFWNSWNPIKQGLATIFIQGPGAIFTAAGLQPNPLTQTIEVGQPTLFPGQGEIQVPISGPEGAPLTNIQTIGPKLKGQLPTEIQFGGRTPGLEGPLNEGTTIIDLGTGVGTIGFTINPEDFPFLQGQVKVNLSTLIGGSEGGQNVIRGVQKGLNPLLEGAGNVLTEGTQQTETGLTEMGGAINTLTGITEKIKTGVTNQIKGSPGGIIKNIGGKGLQGGATQIQQNLKNTNPWPVGSLLWVSELSKMNLGGNKWLQTPSRITPGQLIQGSGSATVKGAKQGFQGSQVGETIKYLLDPEGGSTVIKDLQSFLQQSMQGAQNYTKGQLKQKEAQLWAALASKGINKSQTKLLETINETGSTIRANTGGQIVFTSSAIDPKTGKPVGGVGVIDPVTLKITYIDAQGKAINYGTRGGKPGTNIGR